MEFIAEEVWKRIDRIIAKKFSGNTAAFARKMGFSEARVCNPKYRKTVPLSLINAIKKELKISSDFVLYGDTNPYSIPQELLDD